MDGTYYPCTNSTTAFTAPTLQDSCLSEAERKEIRGRLYTIEQYKVMVNKYSWKGNVEPKLEKTLHTTLSYAKGSQPFKTLQKGNIPLSKKLKLKMSLINQMVIQSWAGKPGMLCFHDRCTIQDHT
eukprot:6284020-Ditylum_brightwellii.AAC.1